MRYYCRKVTLWNRNHPKRHNRGNARHTTFRSPHAVEVVQHLRSIHKIAPSPMRARISWLVFASHRRPCFQISVAGVRIGRGLAAPVVAGRVGRRAGHLQTTHFAAKWFSAHSAIVWVHLDGVTQHGNRLEIFGTWRCSPDCFRRSHLRLEFHVPYLDWKCLVDFYSSPLSV